MLFFDFGLVWLWRDYPGRRQQQGAGESYISQGCEAAGGTGYTYNPMDLLQHTRSTVLISTTI